MRTYIGLTDVDLERVRALAGRLEPRLDEVCERFYAEILRNPGARAAFAGGEQQIQTQKVALRRWLVEMCKADFGPEQIARRIAVGQMHVRVDLPQQYMFAGMEVIRQELTRVISEIAPDEATACVESLQRLLSVESCVMLEAYKHSYAERIRRLEHRAVEERLSRAEHLAELGQLAASLAHEIKNPLAGISGAIQVIRKGLPGDDRHGPILDEVLRQVRRVDRTLKDLLAFARPRPPQIERCDLGLLVDRTVRLLSQEATFAAMSFSCKGTENLPGIDADENQLEQLLMNLLMNAAQASRPGDQIELEVHPAETAVQLVVRDRGSGMDPTTIQRVFEPFFTTKARGTGLGMAVVHRIVEAHDGNVTIDSRPGKGTSVTVRLPLRAHGMENTA